MNGAPVHGFDLENNFHPLFTPIPGGKPDYKPEEFDRIRVFKVTSQGPKQIPHEFLPTELPDAETFVRMLGGGVFELWAIKLPGQTIYTKRTHSFDAPAKQVSFSGAVGSPSNQPTPDPTTPATPAMLGMPPGLPPEMQYYFMQQQEARREERERAREEREREERRRDREDAARREDRLATSNLIAALAPAILQILAPKGDTMADALKAIAEYQRASAPAAPSQSAMGVIKESLELNALIDRRAKDMQPAPKEESTSETIVTVLSAVAPLLQPSAMMGGGSSVGATPSVAESVSRVVGAVGGS